MTDAERIILRTRAGKTVEITASSGERLIVKILWLFEDESDEDLFFELISTSTPDRYPRARDSVCYSLPLNEIESVKAVDV